MRRELFGFALWKDKFVDNIGLNGETLAIMCMESTSREVSVREKQRVSFGS